MANYNVRKRDKRRRKLQDARVEAEIRSLRSATARLERTIGDIQYEFRKWFDDQPSREEFERAAKLDRFEVSDIGERLMRVQFTGGPVPNRMVRTITLDVDQAKGIVRSIRMIRAFADSHSRRPFVMEG